jgi:hypothetical protein
MSVVVTGRDSAWYNQGMGQPIDLTGQRFGRLTVLCLAPRDEWRRRADGYAIRSWLVLCDCGRAPARAVATGTLRHGDLSSCGCTRRAWLGSAKCVAARAARAALVCGERVCVGCGASFTPRARNRVYCGKPCQSRTAQARWLDARHRLSLLAGLEALSDRMGVT